MTIILCVRACTSHGATTILVVVSVVLTVVLVLMVLLCRAVSLVEVSLKGFNDLRFRVLVLEACDFSLISCDSIEENRVLCICEEDVQFVCIIQRTTNV